MARASILLRDERATLAAVAAQVGYGSEAAFSAAFKRYSGMAPGAYREIRAGHLTSPGLRVAIDMSTARSHRGGLSTSPASV